MDSVVARKMWRTLEPLHGMIYFVPEAADAATRFELSGRSGYFALRAAPMGAVSAGVVVATFFNFEPRLVHAAIPAAWDRATPATWTTARLDAADRALRRMLGELLDSADVADAAGLARAAAESCDASGRPLFAGHADLPWPDAPHLVLWHAITLLREFRGDGHVAALCAEGLDGREALVLHGASGEVPPEILRTTRGWSAEAWSSTTDELTGRGLVAPDGGLTPAGRALRDGYEQRTDDLAVAPWRQLGDDGCDRLRSLVRPLSRAVVDSTPFGAPAD